MLVEILVLALILLADFEVGMSIGSRKKRFELLAFFAFANALAYDVNTPGGNGSALELILALLIGILGTYVVVMLGYVVGVKYLR